MASAEILKIGASKEVLESRLKTVLPKIHETFDGQVQVIEESDTDMLDAVMSGSTPASLSGERKMMRLIAGPFSLRTSC